MPCPPFAFPFLAEEKQLRALQEENNFLVAQLKRCRAGQQPRPSTAFVNHAAKQEAALTKLDRHVAVSECVQTERVGQCAVLWRVCSSDVLLAWCATATTATTTETTTTETTATTTAATTTTDSNNVPHPAIATATASATAAAAPVRNNNNNNNTTNGNINRARAKVIRALCVVHACRC
jgi:hypothetical protein